MPNWCNNGLYVFGRTEDVDNFISGIVIPEDERMKDPNTGEVSSFASTYDITRFYPTPIELKETTATFGTPQNDDHALQMVINEEKYGHKDWYDWNIANWGTKWSPTVYSVKTVATTSLGWSITAISMDSAWSPPEGLIRKLSYLHQSLGFILTYEEGGMGFLGVEGFLVGRVIFEDHHEWDDVDAISEIMKKNRDNEGDDDNYFEDLTNTVGEVLDDITSEAFSYFESEFPAVPFNALKSAWEMIELADDSSVS